MSSAQVPEGYKQTELGVIPEDWKIAELGSLGKFKNGINKGSEDFGHGSPFVNLMDVFGVSYILEIEHLGLVNSNDAEKNVYNLKEGDVLFIRSSVKPSGVGLTTVVKKDLTNTVYSGFLIRFRDQGNLETDYKKYCFYEERFRQSVISNSTVSANTNINQDNLKKLVLAYPESLDEQRAIAQALSDVDALIASLDKLIAKQRQLKTAAMQQLLTGKMRLLGFGEGNGYKQTEIGVIPEDWDVYQVSQVTSTHKQGFYTKDRYVDHGIRLVRITDLYNPKIDYESMPMLSISQKDFEQYKITRDDFLFARSGAIGRYGIVEDDIDAIFGSYIIRFNFNFEKLLNEFFGYLFETQIVWKQLLSITQGSSNININAGNIKALKIPIPKLEEQRAIATVLSDMDVAISALEIRRAKTQAIKQGMMQELLTGKIRLTQ